VVKVATHYSKKHLMVRVGLKVATIRTFGDPYDEMYQKYRSFVRTSMLFSNLDCDSSWTSMPDEVFDLLVDKTRPKHAWETVRNLSLQLASL